MATTSNSADNAHIPLAERVRPQAFEDIIGQDHLVGPKGLLRISVQNKKPLSFILWGPPGTGKTTMARIYAKESGLRFIPFSAVMSGIKEVREVMADAENYRKAFHQGTLIFVDEIHRFNKSQQDAFLPYVEKGDITLIGATTENPSFEIISALLSRLRVFQVHALEPQQLQQILRQALNLSGQITDVSDETLAYLAARIPGDGRASINALEACLNMSGSGTSFDSATVDLVLQKPALLYDKGGEEHYNIISALHKSMRNSDADAALYWLARMLEGGEDPLYVVRRMVRFASEDIGNADPQALTLAISVKDTVDFLGMPEANTALAQLAVYLSSCPKSNTSYVAYKEVQTDLKKGKVYAVPLSIRNAPTKLMKGFGYGEGYKYAHDEKDQVADLDCLPTELKNRTYYTPKEVGFERTVKERLDYFKRARERKKS